MSSFVTLIDILTINSISFISWPGTLHKDPDGEIENSEKSFFKIRIPNFCYIQVMVFDLSYLLVAAVGT